VSALLILRHHPFLVSPLGFRLVLYAVAHDVGSQCKVHNALQWQYPF
jgi:hypothetical protein